MMRFTPLKFQLPIAAGGIALMAYNFLLHAVPHESKMLTILDFQRANLTSGQTTLYYPLLGIS